MTVYRISRKGATTRIKLIPDLEALMRMRSRLMRGLREEASDILVIGRLCRSLAFGGLLVETFHPTIWSKIFIVSGLVGFALLLSRWYQKR